MSIRYEIGDVQEDSNMPIRWGRRITVGATPEDETRKTIIEDAEELVRVRLLKRRIESSKS